VWIVVSVSFREGLARRKSFYAADNEDFSDEDAMGDEEEVDVDNSHDKYCDDEADDQYEEDSNNCQIDADDEEEEEEEEKSDMDEAENENLLKNEADQDLEGVPRSESSASMEKATELPNSSVTDGEKLNGSNEPQANDDFNEGEDESSGASYGEKEKPKRRIIIDSDDEEYLDNVHKEEYEEVGSGNKESDSGVSDEKGKEVSDIAEDVQKT